MNTKYDKYDTALTQHIDKAASQCVKCGLCLPHCPTYGLAEDENESPRGRIALMQGAARQQVPVTSRLKFHLDTCLGCRACEAVCPASVQYEDLLTSTRAWLVDTGVHKPRWWEQVLIFVMEKPGLRKVLHALLNIWPIFLSTAKDLCLRRWRSFATLRMTSTAHRATSTAHRPTSTAHRGTSILILPPCASTIFDTKTISDAQQLLINLGFSAKIAEPSYCCGALALHAGELENAKKSAQQQITQWSQEKPDYIITLASGCHSTLQDYAKPPLNMQVPEIPLMTIENFLFDNLKKNIFKPLKQKFVIHIPCTLRNAVKAPNSIMQVLQNIPELNCIPLPNTVQCCGAAGTNFLRHPAKAKALVTPMVEFIQQQKPDAWVTSNIGCAMYVQKELKKQGINILVMHPISVILQSIMFQNKPGHTQIASADAEVG